MYEFKTGDHYYNQDEQTMMTVLKRTARAADVRLYRDDESATAHVSITKGRNGEIINVYICGNVYSFDASDSWEVV